MLLLLLVAKPTLAQFRKARVLSDEPGAWVAVPTPVRAACRRVAPALLADTAASWLAYPPGRGLAAPDTLFETDYEVTYLLPADTLRYDANASFTARGQVRSYTRELPSDSLPRLLRSELRQCTQHLRQAEPGTQLLLVVAYLNPHARRRRFQAEYTFYFQGPSEPVPGNPHYRPVSAYQFWRDGRPVRQPRFR